MDKQERMGTAQRIDSRYELGKHFASTRNVEIYKATDTISNNNVFIVTLRHTLDANTESAKIYFNRLTTIKNINLNPFQIKDFGIDPAGKAFLVLPYIECSPILEANGTLERKLVFFKQVLRLASLLHEADVLISDITAKSFAVDQHGNVLLFSLLGDFGSFATTTSLHPSAETLFYLAPELRSSGGAVPNTDVFALGVLGYRLLTSHYPSGDVPPSSDEDILKLASAPTSLHSKLPIWIDEVLGHALEYKADLRYGDAQVLYEAYKLAHQTGQIKATSNRWVQKTVIVHPQANKINAETHSSNRRSQNKKVVEAQISSASSSLITSKRLVQIVAVSMLVLVIAIIYSITSTESSKPKDSMHEEFLYHEKYAPEELRVHLQLVVSESATLEERKSALNAIGESKDPIAFAVLTSAMNKSPDPALRVIAQDVIINRIRSQGLLQTSRVIARWFELFSQANAEPADSAAFLTILRACDRTVPSVARQEALKRAFASEVEITMLVTAALALDESNDEFIAVLRGFLAQVTQLGDVPGKGVAGLILSYRPLLLFFESDLRQFFPAFSAKELAWGLLKLSDSDSELLNDLARETLRRKIVPPFQAVFLETLVSIDRFKIDAAIRKTLIRGARGEVTELDVYTIGRWLDVASERVMFAMSAVAKEKEVALAAFDTLGARSLHDPVARNLMQWIKAERWMHRANLFKSISILAMHDIASPEQIKFAFDSLMPYSTGEGFVNAMFKIDNPSLLAQVIERFGEVTSSPALVDLLEHDNKEIRIASVKALRGRNELNVLQSIFRAYQREVEADVRQVYEEYHWVTRDRKELG